VKLWTYPEVVFVQVHFVYDNVILYAEKWSSVSTITVYRYSMQHIVTVLISVRMNLSWQLPCIQCYEW